MQKPSLTMRLLPLILTITVIALDQLTKAAIIAWIPVNSVGASFFDNLIRIVHVRNTAIAFSIGANLSVMFRFIVFTILPVVILPTILIFALRTNDLSTLQRWTLMGIIGGGTGNLIDRIGRPEGVVDFIDVRFFGIFGWERWPTFNIADSAVVVCGIVLAIDLLFRRKINHA